MRPLGSGPPAFQVDARSKGRTPATAGPARLAVAASAGLPDAVGVVPGEMDTDVLGIGDAGGLGLKRSLEWSDPGAHRCESRHQQGGADQPEDVSMEGHCAFSL